HAVFAKSDHADIVNGVHAAQKSLPTLSFDMKKISRVEPGKKLLPSDGVEVWNLKGFELIGLLKHREPVVYSSANRAAENTAAKTDVRACDELELDGLKDLP